MVTQDFYQEFFGFEFLGAKVDRLFTQNTFLEITANMYEVNLFNSSKQNSIQVEFFDKLTIKHLIQLKTLINFLSF